MKFFNFNKPASKPNALNPVAVPNLSLGLGGLANNTGTSRMNSAVPEFSSPLTRPLPTTTKKSKFLEGFSSAIGSLGKGLSGSGQSDNFTPSPIQIQNTNRIINNPVDIPQVPQMPTIQQAPLPTGKADYNPLFELQKLIERQRAGY